MADLDGDLESFANMLRQDVLATAEADGTTTHDAFTQRILGHLIDAGEIDDGLPCYYRAHGVEISGYGLTSETNRLDLFATLFRQDVLAASLPTTELNAIVRRAENFAVKSANPTYLDAIDDSNPAWDMVQAVQQNLPTTTQIRLFVLTNSTTRVRTVSVEPIKGVPVAVHVWELHRLHRLLTSGKLHEPINVNFSARYGSPLPALTAENNADDYSVLMAIVPGPVLQDLYAQYGTRLLELNVRGFLQSRGAVNRGIRETILKQPERFLAYNNGISATASSCRLVDTGTGQAIAELTDLQIVNGGQTTASIYHAAHRDRADLSRLFVPAKITVLPPEVIEDVVPQISRFSNTQNKVTTADFSSNEAFHLEVEKLSRSVWAPAPSVGGQETHWFYERARGQYATELGRQMTSSQQRAWKVANPTRQKFTKTDLAKFVNTVEQRPHIVSLGAEKNFREFMAKVNDDRPIVDQAYFLHVIAAAILFRAAESIVTKLALGGYRANVVTYSIAKLAQVSNNSLPFETIWRRQSIPDTMTQAITDLAPRVFKLIVDSAGGANVTEYCKRPEAWVQLAAMTWEPPSKIVEVKPSAPSKPMVGDMDADFDEIPASTWTELSKWARENNRLDPWERSMTGILGTLTASGQRPRPRQISTGMDALDQARREGFNG